MKIVIKCRLSVSQCGERDPKTGMRQKASNEAKNNFIQKNKRRCHSRVYEVQNLTTNVGEQKLRNKHTLGKIGET